MSEIVYIEKMAYGGSGIGKLPGGKVIFVDGAYPGELVEVDVLSEKSDYAIGKLEKIVEKIPERRNPKCPYFRNCGGCNFLDLKYEKQLEFKKMVFMDQLERIAELKLNDLYIEKSSKEYEYRLKMEYSILNDYSFGFKMKNSHKVVSVKNCIIAPKVFGKILEKLSLTLSHFKIPIYNFKRKKGILKHVVLRYSPNGEVMLIFVTKSEYFKEGKKIASLIKKEFPFIKSIVHVMNSNDKIVLRGPYKVLNGDGVINYEFSWEKFQVPPTAFFQNNFQVAEKMVEFLTKKLDLNGDEVVLDLFSGLGTFSLRLAALSKFVIAVESSHVSVKAGRANANINGLKNIKFIEADALDYLNQVNEKFDVIVLDPPRTGIGTEAVKKILELSPQKIGYVSCNPTTFARDLKLLLEKYEIEDIRIFDMFPQTYHIESIAILNRKNNL
jgi:23S rRNA (uracil1939-C5)-methyltransferase